MWTHYWEFVISQASKKVSVFFKFGVKTIRIDQMDWTGVNKVLNLASVNQGIKRGKSGNRKGGNEERKREKKN